jgi:hypothetical protein
MANGRNKYQSRENRARVSEMLLRAWDPIGVNDICPADEYDAYADKVYVMLMDDGTTAEEIVAYLSKVATEHMGLTNYSELARSTELVANALVKLQPEFKTH